MSTSPTDQSQNSNPNTAAIESGNESSQASSAKPSLSYRDAGVDIDAGNALVEQIKHITRLTSRPEVLSELGGFGALCELPSGYERPVMVSATDGVGTKLKLAMQMNKHDTIGIDLVAMCVNDLIVCGAEPLFFLDYYATGGLDVSVATNVVKGIGEGCQQSGCALIGGETAEMPGMYQDGDYDLAGFSVGIVEKERIIQPQRVTVGDVLIGLPSSGPHSNGYSLIRRIIEVANADLSQGFGDSTLGETLLQPTTIYVKPILALHRKLTIHALAHITGGGFLENIPRVLPQQAQAIVDWNSWQRPAIFDWLQERGNVEESEMLRTFNCGVGMVICVGAEDAELALATLHDAGQEAFLMGEIGSRSADEPQVKMS